ncbi:MAG: hypothetical protein U1D36_07800 [Hydrogenophaga sp.]|uniref:hypothetical protein n=1 Tax=Comamonadaceae TaxID=80864 RepID=UPI002730663C|nr:MULTISPECIES: hypothetical protein [Comamonadaceae]MDP2440207.1 hypothetical protein [Rhodoferax sp.]MDZ4174361.1 hypothetical protein [Hydrogenophaga sp.]
MKSQKPHELSRTQQFRARPGEAMGEQRYQELLRGLNHLFQETEQDTQAQNGAERQRVIEEINALMRLHGLTMEDICD